MTMLSDVRVGDPLRHGNLSIFPLFADRPSAVDYLVSDEAIAAGGVAVEEVGEDGSVPELLVRNDGDARVLFLEGEELRGAKQNRVLNTSVLVAAHSRVKIPVSCVEQGRWRYQSKRFASAGTHSSPKLRASLKESVTRSLSSGRGYSSDQGAVWREVARQQEVLGAASPTAAMSDTYETHRARLDEARAALAYVEGAAGLAVAVGPKLVALDVFDKPTTCRKVWDRLLTGATMEALEAPSAEGATTVEDVRAVLDRLDAADWTSAPAVGEGRELRWTPDPATHASALVLDDAVLHGSLVLAV
jgi:hypothetical protein